MEMMAIIEQVVVRSATNDLPKLLARTSKRHSQLCPRQVLGVRMGLYGSELLGVPIPDPDNTMLVILETDGCFADGVRVATDCSIGKRTLRIEDYGKVAATFIHVHTAKAIRLVPRPNVRSRAFLYAEDIQDRYQAQLIGYQYMPDAELFDTQHVRLRKPLGEIISAAGKRVSCDGCGEEIINQREIQTDDRIVCHACLGLGYYSPMIE